MAAKKNKEVITMKIEKTGKKTNKFRVEGGTGSPPPIDNAYVEQWFCGDATEIKITVEVVK